MGSELGHEDGVKEEGLSLRLMSVWSVILWDPLGSFGNHWEPLGVEGHLREVSCHVTCPNAWNQVSNHEDMT